jgi:uncharacterized protein
MSFSNPFVAGARLQDLQKFVGREEELRAIASLMSGDQPTSVNIVGERRIGKSSLLYYFFLTWQQRVLNPNRYVVIYLSLQGATCQREEHFYQAAAEELLDSNAVEKKPALTRALSKIPFDRLAFSEAVKEFKKQGLLPVLCLDDFESLFKHPHEFNNGFYDSLRSMMDDNAIKHRQQWILLFSGSHLRDELPDYWSDYLINSISIQLDYLLESEARELIQRPVEDFPLSIYEPAAVDAIIELTRCQPYLVQLMCYQLVELLNHYIRTEKRLAKTTTATVEDVEKSIPKVLERGDQYFRELWNSLEDKERKLLLRLVQNQALTPQDNKLVRRLIKKEILQCFENSGNNMCYKYASFQVPLVQKYIEQEIDT